MRNLLFKYSLGEIIRVFVFESELSELDGGVI
jgi:hypothetical protein